MLDRELVPALSHSIPHDISAHHTNEARHHGCKEPAGVSYWGVLCRSCAELVAFDTLPYHRLGLGIANAKPGAICCSHGHNHIYFPSDFCFFDSEVGISDASMAENCSTYAATNPSFGR